MNLNESYRYMNFCDKLLHDAYGFLNNKGFLTTTKQYHHITSVNPKGKDEEKFVQKPYDVEFTPSNLINFIMKVVDEKEKLASVISDAKKNLKFDIDKSVSMNKVKHNVISSLRYLEGLKSSEKTSRGTGYKINPIDGTQMSYYYDVDETTTIDFNRNDVKGIIKKFNKECDEMSNKLDKVQIDTEIDFVPLFDVNDSFEDSVLLTI